MPIDIKLLAVPEAKSPFYDQDRRDLLSRFASGSA